MGTLAWLSFPAFAVADDDWSITLIPYGWAISMEGEVASIAALPTIDVDADFQDIFENLDSVLILAAEIKKGRVGLLADVNYLSLELGTETPGTLFDDVDAETSSLIGGVYGTYRIVEGDGHSVDVLGGGRVWSVETTLDFQAGTLPAVRTSDSKTWVDPIVGARGALDLTPNFGVTLLADVGGFGVSSDFSWQALATVDYRVNDWITGRLGYRHLAVDYEDGGFVYDVDISGPVIGLSMRW